MSVQRVSSAFGRGVRQTRQRRIGFGITSR